MDLSVRLVFVGSGTVCASLASFSCRLRRLGIRQASPARREFRLSGPFRSFRDLHDRHPASRAASCGRPASCGPSGVRHPAAPRGAVPAPAGPRAAFWAPHRPRHLPSRAGEGGGVQRRLTVVRALASLALPRPVRRRPGGGAVAALAALFDHPRLSRPAWDARTTPISDPRSSTSEAPLQRTHRPTPGPARRTNTNGGKERQPRQEDNNRKNPENPEQKGLLPKNNARHRAGRLAPLPRTCPERTQPRRRLVPARLPVRPTSGGDAAAVDAPRSRARHAATPPSAALTRLAPGPHRAAARLAPRRANARLRASCPADRAAILAASALLASSPRLSRPFRTRPAEPPPETA